MTRKDFELIAKVIDDLYMGHDDWNRKLDQVASKFADALVTTNPLFDRQKFNAAAKGVAR